jgi:outer membrane protein assembly factor BamB
MKKRLLPALILLLVFSILLTGCSSATGTAVNTWGGAAVADSMVYYASGAQVLALSDSGSNYTLRWTYPAKAAAGRLFLAEPLVVGEQLILGDYSSNLTSVSVRDGVENWQFQDATGRYIDSPLLVGDVLYAPNADGTVYAVDLTGKLVWKSTKDGAFWAKPATDGKYIFAPSLNHKLYAMDLQTGEQLWETDLKSPLAARPLYDNGVIYLGNLSGAFFAINAADGTVKWTQKMAGGVWSQPILENGNLYFGDQTGTVNILSAEDGKIIAQTDTGSAILGAGAIVPDGIIFGTENGKIILFDLEGKNRPLMTLENGSIYSNIIVNGERMVVVAYKGNKPLVALDLNGNEAWFYSTKK